MFAASPNWPSMVYWHGFYRAWWNKIKCLEQPNFWFSSWTCLKLVCEIWQQTVSKVMIAYKYLILFPAEFRLYLCWLTLVNIAQGRAEMKLIIQISRIIFRASPIVDRAIGDRGLHMAIYLKKYIWHLMTSICLMLSIYFLTFPFHIKERFHFTTEFKL